jgi:hypothetical protein
MVGRFISKAAPIGDNNGNFRSYLPEKLRAIGKQLIMPQAI